MNALWCLAIAFKNQAHDSYIIIYSLIDYLRSLSQRIDSLFIIFGLLFFVTGFITSSGISLLDKSKSDTFSSWDGDSGGFTVTNNKDVFKSGGEGVTLGVFDVTDFVGTWMLLDGGEDTDSTNVVSSNKHDSGSGLELDNTSDGLRFEVEL